MDKSEYYFDNPRMSRALTLFAFGEGQGLSEHIAPFDALVYLLDGEAEVTISGKTLRLSKDEMVIMITPKIINVGE